MHQHQTRIAEATWPMKRTHTASGWLSTGTLHHHHPRPRCAPHQAAMERQPPCESKPARHTPELMTSALARVWARRGAQLQSRACGAAPRVSWLAHLPHVPTHPYRADRFPHPLTLPPHHPASSKFTRPPSDSPRHGSGGGAPPSNEPSCTQMPRGVVLLGRRPERGYARPRGPLPRAALVSLCRVYPPDPA